MLVNKYESLNVEQTPDDWMTLCAPCATRYASQVSFTAEGGPDDGCEFCDAEQEVIEPVRSNAAEDRYNRGGW